MTSVLHVDVELKLRHEDQEIQIQGNGRQLTVCLSTLRMDWLLPFFQLAGGSRKKAIQYVDDMLKRADIQVVFTRNGHTIAQLGAQVRPNLFSSVFGLGCILVHPIRVLQSVLYLR